ncbi:unnamed protein product, partial [Amoebophrya sp. A25]
LTGKNELQGARGKKRCLELLLRVSGALAVSGAFCAWSVGVFLRNSGKSTRVEQTRVQREENLFAGSDLTHILLFFLIFGVFSVLLFCALSILRGLGVLYDQARSTRRRTGFQEYLVRRCHLSK